MQKPGFQNRRRNYFIKKEFQAKFILRFCVLIVLSCFLMGLLVYFLSAKTTTTSFENLRLVVKSTKDFLLPALLLSSLVAIIIVSLACIFIVLFLSHRIAGPLYRFEKSLEEIAKGNLTVHTRLRETDEVKVMADSLNDTVAKLRNSISAAQKEAGALEGGLTSFREKLNKFGVPQHEIDAILKPYQAALTKLKENLSYFKTE